MLEQVVLTYIFFSERKGGMNLKKLTLFFRLYQQQKGKYALVYVMFLCVSVVMSCTLFIKENNKLFYEMQISNLQVHGWEQTQEQLQQELLLVQDTVGEILNTFSFASILIGIWGAVTIFFFQVIHMQTSYAMLRIYGMGYGDFIKKAAVEAALYGLLAGIPGNIIGFYLFGYLAKKLCDVSSGISLLSKEMLVVCMKNILVIFCVFICVGVITGTYTYHKSLVNILHERKEKEKKKEWFYITSIMSCGLFFFLKLLMEGKEKYLERMLMVCVGIMGLLFIIFYIVFGVFISKRRRKRKIKEIHEISFCFLCTRKKRDALLAATISAGAVLICFVLNILLNFSELIRESYIDNMGYSIAIRMEDWHSKDDVQEVLDANGYGYTTVYSKLMRYEELDHVFSKDGYFWALVLGKQTDSNAHFQVEQGAFLVENYFSNMLGIVPGQSYNFFGEQSYCVGRLQDNQALSLVSYNFLVHEENWRLGLDESWSAVLLLNVNKIQEQEIQELIKRHPCQIETATMITDALSELMRDYLSIVTVVGSLLILVVGSIFCSMIGSDLRQRKKEVYLYRIYGAAKKQALQVIYREYFLLAWIAAFGVVFAVTIIGEAFFLFMLKKHYPISGPVVFITSFLVTLFVLICCVVAEKIYMRHAGTEMIRDE